MHFTIRPGRRARPVHAAAAASLALIAALLAGCSAVPERDVLARIGERTLTTADFDAVAADNVSQYPFEPDSAKGALLDDLVRRELMLAEGHRLGLDRGPEAAKPDSAFEREILTRALLDRLVPKTVPVSDGEVAQLHQWRTSKARTFLIYTPARGTAEQAIADLKAGRPFAEVFERTSLPGVVPPGGDVGWVVAGQLIDPLDTAVRTAPVGEPQGPLAAPTEGWFVVLVTERQPQPPGDLAAEKPFLTDMLRQRKQRGALMAAIQDLRRQYRIEVAPRGPQLLFAIGNSAPGQEPEFDRAEVLATYDGGPGLRGDYTAADAMADLTKPNREHAPFSSTAALEAWIDNQVVQRVAELEARRRRLQDEPDVARRLRARVDNAVLEQVVLRLVEPGLEVTEAEVRAAFDARVAAMAAAGMLGPQGVPPFESLPEDAIMQFRQQALAVKRDAKLNQVTADLARTIRPYQVHRERLAARPWPAPPMPAGMMMGGAPGDMPAGHP